MTRVKICGITNSEDARTAAGLGAWALGFIFYKKSPRYVSPFKAQKIIASLPPFVTPVGVFVNQKEGAVKDIASFSGVRAVQFHGDESPAYCRRFKKQKVIKAFRVGPDFDPQTVKGYEADAFLFDTFREGQYGGSGASFDWHRIKGLKNLGIPIVLSGGLSKDNIRQALDEVRPYAVDLSSSVEEKPGQKSRRALQELFNSLAV